MSAPQEGRVLALFGTERREGAWVAPRLMLVRSIFGETRLDLREATLPVEGMEIDCWALAGSIRLILPPGVRVDAVGVGIVGEFTDRSEPGVDPTAPVVRIRGTAMLSECTVETRRPGESDRDALTARVKAAIRKLPG